MDPYGHIYEAENVPPEDKARLDGFLKARAEAGGQARRDGEIAALHAERVALMERELAGGN